MKKKQILKEQKKIKMETRQTERLFHDDKEVYNVFKIGIGVILFIGVVFALINIFNGNWNLFSKKNDAKTEIDSSMLIIGNMFDKDDDRYLVLMYDMQDDNSTYYAYLASNYSYSSPKLYYVDLSSGFNRDFLGNETIISEDLSQLKISRPVLLIISGGRIVNSYTTDEELERYFITKE